MRFLQRLGWISALFGLVVLGGQIWSDSAAYQVGTGVFDPNLGVQRVFLIIVQVLWVSFTVGAIAMGIDKYWGRWLIVLSGLFLLGELIDFEVIPVLAQGLNQFPGIMGMTWPGFIIGRGPISFVLLVGIVSAVILKGLARRPSSSRRGAEGEYIRTRETD